MVKCRGNAANNFLLMESQYSPMSEHNDEAIPTGTFDILVVKLSTAQIYDIFHFPIKPPPKETAPLLVKTFQDCSRRVMGVVFLLLEEDLLMWEHFDQVPILRNNTLKVHK